MDWQLSNRGQKYREAQQTEAVQADAEAFDSMVANYRDAGLQLFQEKKRKAAPSSGMSYFFIELW